MTQAPIQQVQVSVEELRKKKLFIATPMFAGQCTGMYMKACLDLQGLCTQYGFESRFSFIFNESLITRARNYLVDEFLRSGMTHLLFLDADIHFDPRDIIGCLALDKDIIGAPYPKKSIKWVNALQAIHRGMKWKDAIEAVKSNSDITEQQLREITTKGSPGPADIEQVIGDYVFNPVAGTTTFNVGQPLRVMEIGTGFMMVKRHVFERYQLQYPEYKYKPDHVGQANFDGSRYIHAFFDCIIDRKRTITIVQDYGERKKGDVLEVGGSDRYLSEDYHFCQLYRNMGGEIWLCPWMRTFHVGTYAFQGNMPAVAKFVGNL